MAEETPATTNPEEFRGGAAEPDQAKGGTGEQAKGVVPAELRDAQPEDTSDPQELGNESQGDFLPRNAPDRIDLSAGDNADATSLGASGGARGSDAGLGRHEDKSVDEDNPDATLEDDK